MPETTHPLVSRIRSRSVPLTAVALLLLGWLFLALNISGILSYPLVEPGSAVWLQAILLLVAAAVMLAKRRRPLTALAVGTVLFAADSVLGGSLGMLLVVIDLLYAATLCTTDRGRRVLLALVTVCIAGGTVAALIVSGTVRDAVIAAIALFAMLATPYWWALAVHRERTQAALEAQRADAVAQVAQLTQHDAVREERARMARDLHDAIASELSAIAIHAEASLASPTPPTASLHAIRDASVRSLEQMRTMILVLRSGGDPPTAPGTLSSANSILDRARARGLAVTITGTAPAMPVAVDQAAGRILQEALTNAMKHAPGSPVAVHIDDDGRTVTMQIESETTPGAQPAAPPSAGLGLRMLHERAAAVGGTFAAGPQSEGGARWSVQTTLPLTSEPALPAS